MIIEITRNHAILCVDYFGRVLQDHLTQSRSQSSVGARDQHRATSEIKLGWGRSYKIVINNKKRGSK